ncbi:MAG: hypothetical protein WB789_10400 [Thermoplasmata archaeon]
MDDSDEESNRGVHPGHDPSKETRFKDQLLWHYLVEQDRSVVTQFTTTLIGEGALLFAFVEIGALSSAYGFVRLLIALLGLWTGLVLCGLSWTSWKTARETEAHLSSTMNFYKDIRQPSWMGFDMLRVTVFTNGLVALLWANFLIRLISEYLRPGIHGMALQFGDWWWVLLLSADAVVVILSSIYFRWVSRRVTHAPPHA